MTLLWAVLISGLIINLEMVAVVLLAPWAARKAMKRAMQPTPKKLSSEVRREAV